VAAAGQAVQFRRKPMKSIPANLRADSVHTFLGMPMHHCRFLLLSMICSACLAACDSKNAFEYWNDRDYFFEGGEFSTTVSRESGVQVSNRMAHSSGYLAREQNDYWRVTWRVTDLKEGIENPPTKVTYLGRYESKRDGSTSGLVSESGLNLEMSDFTGDNHVLVWNDDRFLSPKLPITGKVPQCAERSSDGETRTILTPSRRHMLIWDKPFVICDTHTLQTIREISETEAVAKLRGLHDSSVGTHDIALTDDLRYLCVIPHNGNDAPYGHNHHRVWGYDILEDRFFEKNFQFGSGDTAVVSVQSWKGRPYFLVSSETRALRIFDEEQKVVAEIPPEAPPGGGGGTFWRPDQPNVWFPKWRLDSEQKERQIELYRFNCSNKTTAIYKLNAGKLRVP
jgi:hypothetical protein